MATVDGLVACIGGIGIEVAAAMSKLRFEHKLHDGVTKGGSFFACASHICLYKRFIRFSSHVGDPETIGTTEQDWHVNDIPTPVEEFRLPVGKGVY